MDRKIQQAAAVLSRSRLTVALTGAGISVESGIPPFRGPGSLWETLDPMEFAHIDAFMKNPARVWAGFISGLKESLDNARPNPGHLALAALETRGLLAAVITQNIDSLHQRAGSREVIEFHGTFARLTCLDCGRPAESSEPLTMLPPRCPCGGILRPDCVFFGEAIPMAVLTHARELASRCEAMLVVGTSATVQPAAMMPILAKENGATIIEINPAPTPLTATISDIFLQGPAGPILTRLTQAVAIPASPPASG